MPISRWRMPPSRAGKRKIPLRFWRPVTAIPLADTDGNPATSSDPAWMLLFATPAHREYPSGHSTVSGAAAGVLASFFGERKHFTVDNDLLIGVTRSFRSFSESLDEVRNARIFAEHSLPIRVRRRSGDNKSCELGARPCATSGSMRIWRKVRQQGPAFKQMICA